MSDPIGEKMKRDAQLADLAHARYYAEAGEMVRSAIAFGLEAIRIAAVINGGAVAAGLAFVASLQSSDRWLAHQLMPSVYAFSAGAIACGLASAVAYFCQTCFATSLQKSQLDWSHPYVHQRSAAAKRWDLWGRIFQVVAILFVALAYVLIAYGGIHAWSILGK